MNAADRRTKVLWTDDELRALVELRGIGFSFSMIGERLGKTKNACIGQMRRCVEESDKFEPDETSGEGEWQ